MRIVLDIDEAPADIENDWSTSQGFEQDACPFLALRDDPGTYATYIRTDHVCRIAGVPAPTAEWQTRYCLGSQHDQCPHFRTKPAQLVTPAAPRRPRDRPSWTIIAAAAGLGVALVVGAMIAFMGRNAADSRAIVSPTRAIGSQVTSPSALPVANPPLGVLPTLLPPTVAATPSSPPLSTATALPPTPLAPSSPPLSTATALPSTPPPLPSPTPQAPPTHIVAAGETLSGIAEQYQTTVAELVKLNAINNPNNLPVGLVLRLPPPSNPTPRPP